MRTLLARRDTELRDGATALGWKVGLNAPALQEHFGLSGPIVGYLTDATLLEPGRPVDLEGWQQPMLEVELAIRMGEGGEIAAVGPALELVDLDVPFDRMEPILAGNVFHRGVLFGPEWDGVGGAAGVGGADLAVAAVVTRAGVPVAEGRLTEQPEVTVAWVTRFLAAHGAALRPGERIIAGSLTPALPVAPGEVIDASFGPMGSLGLAFSPRGAAPR